MADRDPPSAVLTELEVTPAKADKMGVARYGQYLRWFKRGRAELYCSRERTVLPAAEPDEQTLPVVESYVRYTLPAQVGDRLRLRTTPGDVTEARFKLVYTVERGDELVARGETTHRYMGPADRERHLPHELVAFLTGQVLRIAEMAPKPGKSK